MKQTAKKVIILFSLVIALVIPNTVFASTLYNAGFSNPQTIDVYGINTWSEQGYWDLTNVTSIPDTAVVELVSETWSICSACGMNYSATNVALFKEDGNGYYMTSDGQAVNWFAGEPVKQVWSTAFHVSNNLIGGHGSIQASLRIWWTDPLSETSGVADIPLSGSTKVPVTQ